MRGAARRRRAGAAVPQWSAVLTVALAAFTAGCGVTSGAPGAATGTDATPYDQVAAMWTDWPETTFDDRAPDGFVYGWRVVADEPVDRFDPAWLSRCYVEDGPGSFSDWDGLDWAPPQVTWYRLDVAPEVTEHSARDATLDLAGLQPVRGPAHGRAATSTTVARRLQVAVAYGGSLAVAVRPSGHVHLVAAIDGDQAVFLACGPHSQELQDFASDRQLAPSEVVDRVVDGELTEDDLVAWWEESTAPPAWEALPADQRFLDSTDDEVPDAAGETAVIVIAIDSPGLEYDELRGRIVCPVSDVATSECVDLGVGPWSSITPRVSLEVPLRLEVFEEDDGWLVGSVVVATVAVETLAELVEDGRVLHVRGIEEVDPSMGPPPTGAVTVEVWTEQQYLDREEEAVTALLDPR